MAANLAMFELVVVTALVFGPGLPGLDPPLKGSEEEEAMGAFSGVDDCCIFVAE